jgi:hypothetical protein
MGPIRNPRWSKNGLRVTLSYLPFTKLFQVEICSQQLEICKSVCMFIVLAIELWRLITFPLFCSDDCPSWPCEEKINNHRCWGKHAHIPDNDYWGICPFHVVWTNFFFAIILMWYTRNIRVPEKCRFCRIGRQKYVKSDKNWFFVGLPDR